MMSFDCRGNNALGYLEAGMAGTNLLVSPADWTLVLAEAHEIAKEWGVEAAGNERVGPVPKEARGFLKGQIEVHIGSLLLFAGEQPRNPDERVRMPEEVRRQLTILLGSKCEVDSIKELRAWHASG